MNLLGSYNREKAFKMVVPKRQGREKPTNIEQRKVKGGPRTGVRTSGKTALLTKPNLHRAGPGGRKKTYKKRSQRAGGHSLSLPHARALFSYIFGSTCPHASKLDFPAIF